jgi:uncharacterized protein
VIGLGTIINAIAIILGGIVGLAFKKSLSPANQMFIKLLLGVATVYIGLSMTWGAIGGGFGSALKQLGIVILALMLGNVTGKLLRIQRNLNRLGQYAKERFSKAQPGDANRFSEGFITCSLLFCVGPMAILGSVQDGLTGDFKTLALKGAMDGLATMAFVGTFGWGVMLAVIPVVAYQGTLTLLARGLAPYLEDPALLNSVSATGGLLVFCVALIILEIKRIELADYLPSLAYAPLLTWLWR